MNELIKQFFKNKADPHQLLQYQDEAFSSLMLNEHLEQSTIGATRPDPMIKKEVRFIDALLREKKVRSVLDIGCGPGKYIYALRELGYQCNGVDVSPVVVRHARKMNPESQIHCGRIEDFRAGAPMDAAVVLYGLCNEVADLGSLLESARIQIATNGYLLLELMKPEFITELANETLSVSERSNASCFSQHPHYRLVRRFYDPDTGCLVNRSLVLDNSGDLIVRESHFFSYSFHQISAHLSRTGFDSVQAAKPNESESLTNSNYYYVLARKREF